MAINTIKEALDNMCVELGSPAMLDRARQAIADGKVLEVTILISPAKQGAAVTMHSLVASDRQSHGRLIRLK